MPSDPDPVSSLYQGSSVTDLDDWWIYPALSSVTWRLDSKSLPVKAVFEQRLLLGYVEGRPKLAPNEGDKVPPTINFITI